MNFIEKLEKYFNTGSTDKQNKRRLGGLLVAITAILLVISILAMAGYGAFSLVSGIINGFGKGNGGDGGESVNRDLVAVSPEQVATDAALNTIMLNSTVPTNMTVKKFSEVNRFKNGQDKNDGYIYKATLAEGLQPEAETAFTAMMTAYQAQNSKDYIVWADKAYSETNNSGHYVNALAVAIGYEYYENEGDTETKVGAINSTDFKWIYDNAYKYGFVRVSATEGEENIFRYVGLAHAKYIADKQAKSKADNFYTIEKYLEELKATAPDNKKNITGIKELGGKTTATYYAYYMAAIDATAPEAPAEGESAATTTGYRLPNSDKFNYSVMALEDGGYIVTYTKKATTKK